MSERTATVAGVLIVSMFIGCSYERNIGRAAPAPTPQQSHAGVIDHFFIIGGISKTASI
jgi:hypothetical protein